MRSGLVVVEVRVRIVCLRIAGIINTHLLQWFILSLHLADHSLHFVWCQLRDNQEAIAVTHDVPLCFLSS